MTFNPTVKCAEMTATFLSIQPQDLNSTWYFIYLFVYLFAICIQNALELKIAEICMLMLLITAIYFILMLFCAFTSSPTSAA